MHDNTTHLVKMANDISNFFRLRPEEQAVAGTANHIKRFWDPRMRTKMAEHLAHGGAGLNPIALKAVQQVCKPAVSAATAPASSHS
ncbi:MAG TPA: formate dehydrogenase subunit delta [Micropepsaceae bacterium]|jgi:formate dehydrogenase subunit delta|nr:formate dehydrogenase subunit delta [Micropepsaceae bacterium]